MWSPRHREDREGFVHASSVLPFSLDGGSQGRPMGDDDDDSDDDDNVYVDLHFSTSLSLISSLLSFQMRA